jgi:hypothetical protein
LVSGQALDSSTTEASSWANPADGRSGVFCALLSPADRGPLIRLGKTRCMTSSIAGRCPEAVQSGVVTAASTIAAGTTVAHCAAGIGAVLIQHLTDRRLGPRGLGLPRSAGLQCAEMIDALAASTPHARRASAGGGQ